ncbi:MAG: phosphotransferase [Specibacter sp.]
MHEALVVDLDALGAAKTDAGKVAQVAAVALGRRSVELHTASAAEIPFPMFNMTTGGLWRVDGSASFDGPAQPFKSVVKLIQSPRLWPGIAAVPPDFRDALVRHYPWHSEADVYASDMAGAMPTGSRLPAVYLIEELDPERTAIWMEDIPECPGADWNDARFSRAASMLGRLAGSAAVRDGGPPISPARDAERMRFFLEGYGTTVLIPSILGEDLWKVPAVAEVATTSLVEGMRRLAGRAPELMEEIIALPILPAHGDASPQNLLADGPEDFAVIDWGLYGGACAGFDLGQLLAGWVNQGAMDGGELYRLEPLCFASYCQGLAEAGTDVPDSVVRRGHAASMALFSGLTAVPSQRLAEADSEELRKFVAGRVAMAKFVLELLASTE